ncbi:MAG TPA: type II toxin-antitoxin system VapC family toxin [Bryobacteraceae bacterium]|nr:type II toxin-antitoxin system VapC family toxin [Bryobacteraceae bacterium]
MSEPLLLDTHCWLWLQFGYDRKFKRQSRQAIERAMRRNDCVVSIISIWEFGMLASKGRVRINNDKVQWVNDALKTEGITLIPLTPEAAMEASNLPGEFHGDPADRLLVATARHLGATLVTADECILEYGRQKHVRFLAC